MHAISIPARFNGPPASGQGGYSCGVLATRLDGPASVSLRRPVPLDRELELRPGESGGTLAFAARELVAEAAPAPALAAWDGPAVGLVEARAARRRHSPPAGAEFSHCFVRGTARENGFDIFTGPVTGTDLVASPWTPPARAAGADGAAAPEFVWAALDCPGYFALHGDDHTSPAECLFVVPRQPE